MVRQVGFLVEIGAVKQFFIFDVESVGLHGEAFAVAGGVYLENGAAQWEFAFNVDPDMCNGDPEGRKWIADNVPAMVPTHRRPSKMRDAFWESWLKAKQGGAEMAVECGWPVEARFLAECVDDDRVNRMWQGPYPLHEVASYMAAAGMNPMATYERLPSELPAHNPLGDARLSARLLSQAISPPQPKS
jgi:hypothetical protein